MKPVYIGQKLIAIKNENEWVNLGGWVKTVFFFQTFE